MECDRLWELGSVLNLFLFDSLVLLRELDMKARMFRGAASTAFCREIEVIVLASGW